MDLLKKMNLIDENEKIVDYLFEIPGLFFLCPSCQQDTVNNSCLPKIHTLSSEHNSNDDEPDETPKEDEPEISRKNSVENPLLTPFVNENNTKIDKFSPYMNK